MAAPNILWIVTTQWRAQAFGYAGDVNARTPAIDRLAARSVNYRQAVTPHPFGPFARAALLTGMPSPKNGVREYFDPLPRQSVTIAHKLADRGYTTAYFGKWHLGRRDPAAPLVGEAHARTIVPPEDRGGFEFWQGFESGFLLNDPWLHGNRLPEPVQFPGYQSDVLCNVARSWIADYSGSQPWFVVVSLEPPHPPYDAPAAGIKPLNPAALVLSANVPRGGEVEARARRELSGYYAHIEATDRAIGQFIDSVAQAIIVFTSTHGDMHGAHGLFRKGWPYEESVRVPLLVNYPGRRGSVSDETVSLMDLSTMTLALADGVAPQAPSRDTMISMPSVVPFEDQCDRTWRGVRSPDRKFVNHGTGTPWLEFNLGRDPLEQRNLIKV